jgi:flagellar hook-associated protein 3 FlgL
MQQNNLANINTNKIYQDKLSNQMSTQKKVNRPSDDPVVAIRALRLRSSVTEITQYYDKNIPDAESWLSVTEDGLKNLSEIVTNMITQCNKAANSYLDSSNRQIILEQLKALGDEVYSTGDADYAGRYVFTGYRTDTPLSFQTNEDKKYSITEQLHTDALDTVTSVTMGKLLELNSSNFDSADMSNVTEQSVDSVTAYRLRLAYDQCDADSTLKIEFYEKSIDPGTEEAVYTPTTWASDGSGDAQIETVHSFEDPYTKASEDPDAIIFVPETGEMLLGENRYNQLMTAKDDPSTTADESEIRVTYDKSKWVKGDLRPEHYFYCESEDIVYNDTYFDPEYERQDIEYDVGFNQTIRVNSTADECFDHGIGREVDDLVNALTEVQNIEAVKVKIKSAIENADAADKEVLQTRLDAVEKALTLANDKCQKMFESGITSFQKHLDKVSLSITNCGTRSSKLELIKTRMQNQKTTFETLKSENEDIDITEVAIQLSSAELTYEAALMATGKVMQTTLLNYI